jgi:putative Mn2+ efflux pump MntP
MLLSSFLIALILSLDAMAVSIANGICIADLSPHHAVRESLFFGVFQFAMPVAGWLIGAAFHSYILGFSRWLAFGLLVLAGAKMILESFGIRDPASCSD